MSRTRLVLIPPTADSPAPWLTVDADGNVLERGLLTLETPFAGPPIRTVAVAPGADILVRFLDLPKGTIAQTRAAALWSLKDQLAATTDRVRIAVGPAPAEGLRVVAVVGEALLAAWVDWLAGLGLKADVIVPASLTLTEPADDLTLTAVGFGATLALRGRDFAAGVDPDMAEAIAGGRRIEPARGRADRGHADRRRPEPAGQSAAIGR